MSKPATDLSKEWDPEKNPHLSFSQFWSAKADDAAYWKCKEGHGWKAKRSKRVAGQGCPYCAGRKVLPGFNDFATTAPELLLEWDWNLNSNISPTQISAGSSKKVWWIRGCGHSWRATPYERKRGYGCSVCSGKVVLPGVNDMATTHPQLAKEFDLSLNAPITPHNVVAGTNKVLAWICPAGHGYKAPGAKRASRGDSCPFCSRRKVLKGFNDLATTHPELASSWSESNLATPDEVLAGSHRKFFWRCPDGHVDYEASVKNRLYGAGCPRCSHKIVQQGVNDLATLFPELSEDWDLTLNGQNVPENTFPWSHKKAFWTCTDHGSFSASIAHRVNGRGCPSCASRGFNPLIAGTFYYIQNLELRAMKFGITNVEAKEQRLKAFIGRGWEILHIIQDSDGKLVLALEEAMLTWVRKELSLPIYLGKVDMGRIGGWTETFSADGVDPKIAIEKIGSVYVSLENSRAR